MGAGAVGRRRMRVQSVKCTMHSVGNGLDRPKKR